MANDAASDHSSHESEWEDPEEEEHFLFKAFHDEQNFGSLEEMLAHEAKVHQFDLHALRHKHKLDLYGAIRLVNYVRKTGADTEQVVAQLEAILADDTLMRPEMEDDAVLFHLDDDDLLDRGETETAQPEADLQTRYKQLEAQYAALQEQMRTVLLAHAKASSDTDSEKSDDKPDNDSYYFESYGYNEIHETMLRDAVRTDAYRDAVYGNKDLFADKVVMDVGCGTGILSLFAARAGARHVYAIDNSSIIAKAQSNAFENGLQDKITFIKGKVEDIKLPGNVKVDVLISEWMGYALLYEAMLDSVICARDRFLKPDGLMMPSQITLEVGALTDSDYWNDRVNYWNDVYGFKMNAMKEKQFDDILIDYLPQDKVSGSCTFARFDLHTVKVEDLVFTGKVELAQHKEETMGFVVWFDTFFGRSRNDKVLEQDLQSGQPNLKKWGFTTGPGGDATHWKQAVLLLEKALPSSASVQGTMTFRKNKENPRFLEVEAAWQDSKSSNGTKSQAWQLS